MKVLLLTPFDGTGVPRPLTEALTKAGVVAETWPGSDFRNFASFLKMMDRFRPDLVIFNDPFGEDKNLEYPTLVARYEAELWMVIDEFRDRSSDQEAEWDDLWGDAELFLPKKFFTPEVVTALVLSKQSSN